MSQTVMTTAQSGVIIAPHNYLYADPSRQSRQMIRIDHPGANDTITEVHTFGVQAPNGSVDFASIAPDYYAYAGDTGALTSSSVPRVAR